MKERLLIILIFGFWVAVNGQSFEAHLGTERIFIDAQYLKFFETEKRLSLFSRARATAAYNEQSTDLFTAAYLNYTTSSGLGGTVLGRISSNSSGIDVGVHYFKANKKFMVFMLPSINIGSELLYSWFSLLRFTPGIKANCRLYLSLELFSAFGQIGHLSSVQRIRIGLDKKGYQYGLAVNFNESRFARTDINPGIFLRKQF